jgi:SagB-type dehydrogenase family enzyme
VTQEPFLISSLHHLSPKERAESRGGRFPDPFLPALQYHEASKYHPNLMSRQAPQSRYALPDHHAGRTESWISLPAADGLPPLRAELGDVLLRRRSRYNFGAPITLRELAVLLTYALGVSALKEVRDTVGNTYTLRLRTYPSGGALYPVETWVYLHRVEGAEPGVYRYNAHDHRLYRLAEEPLNPTDVAAWTPGTDPQRNPLFSAEDFTEAAAFFFLIADFTCQADKYGPRAYRLTLMEAGHMAQNLLLAATGLGLSAVPIAGFYDNRANRRLHLDGRNQALLYLLPVGKPKEGETQR